MRRWRLWLLDIPARAVDTGFTVYRLYLMALMSAAIVLVFISLLLALFGVRWGV